MAAFDDFEIIDETGLSSEPSFDLIDEYGPIEKHTIPNTPTTIDVVLPFLVPKPLVEETLQIFEQETFKPITNTPEPEEPSSAVHTTISITPFIPIKQTIAQPPSPPRVFVPVPLLPKAPPLQRFGAAASIPHQVDSSLDIDKIIDKSREYQQNALHVSIQQQQDIQAVLEQRRRLLNKTNF